MYRRGLPFLAAFFLINAAAAGPVAVPPAVGTWAREKGYYKIVEAQQLPFEKFELTRCRDGTVILIYGRGYLERLPGSHT